MYLFKVSIHSDTLFTIEFDVASENDIEARAKAIDLFEQRFKATSKKKREKLPVVTFCEIRSVAYIDA